VFWLREKTSGGGRAAATHRALPHTGAMQAVLLAGCAARAAWPPLGGAAAAARRFSAAAAAPGGAAAAPDAGLPPAQGPLVGIKACCARIAPPPRPPRGPRGRRLHAARRRLLTLPSIRRHPASLSPSPIPRQVLDLGQVVAGNFAGALLGYFGADVIKARGGGAAAFCFCWLGCLGDCWERPERSGGGGRNPRFTSAPPCFWRASRPRTH